MRRRMRWFISLTVAALVVLGLAFAVPSNSATKLGGCPASENWTAVDFVYSGNYQATGLYQYAWGTYPALGAALPGHLGTSGEANTYFAWAEVIRPYDRNGDQTVCMYWLGGNRGQADYWTSVVDNHTGRG